MTAVERIMEKQIPTACPNSSIRAVWTLFLKNNSNAIPIIDRHRHVVGIVTKTDVLQLLYPDYGEYVAEVMSDDMIAFPERELRDVAKRKIKDIMHRNVYFTRSDTSLMHALARMIARHVNQLPVLNQNDRLIGMVTKDNIFYSIYQIHLSMFRLSR